MGCLFARYPQLWIAQQMIEAVLQMLWHAAVALSTRRSNTVEYCGSEV